jgi:putative molybdopterin biosynthesis protein
MQEFPKRKIIQKMGCAMSDTLAYTPEEIAKLLKITRYTVYEMIKRGDLPAYRIGRKMRVEAPDLDAYIKKSKGAASTENAFSGPPTDMPRPNPDEIVICGQDSLLDILTRHLEKELPQVRILRNYAGSIDGLFALYHGKVNAATTHLWDSDTDSYNTPFVRRLLPGHQTLIVNLAYRCAGFYIPKRNPKNIHSWPDLAKQDVRFVNRERGSGARVLLDEKLRIHSIDRDLIDGYDHEETSHLAVASCVARGEADVGLGIEKVAMQVKELDFIPLQKERYDLVIRKEDAGNPKFKAMLSILRSKRFQNELRGMGGYDLSQTGEVVGET